MFQTFHVGYDQRAVLFRSGLPVEALGPGHHRRFGRAWTIARYEVDRLLVDADGPTRAVLPAGWVSELAVGSRERAFLFRDGRPRLYLGPGLHRHWAVDPSIEAQVVSLEDPPPNDPVLVGLIPAHEVVSGLVGQHQRGLLYVEGRFEGVLGPGRYRLWTTAERPVSVQIVDMRRQILPVAGQELMTRDKVTLRLSLNVEWAPLDPAEHVHRCSDPKGALYGLVQLAIRDFVAGVTLDELLEGRDGLTAYLRGQVVPEAQAIGIEVVKIGLKDIILPGDMKQLFNRVIEAEKDAAARTIERRDRAQETRALANAAELMAERPMLLRLKELETLTSIAGKVSELKIALGSDALKALLPKAGPTA